MKRDYSTGTKTTPIFFVGTEVEHTPAHGQKTLFVVDKQDPNEIVEYARTALISFLVIAVIAAIRAVIAPITAITLKASGVKNGKILNVI